MKQKPLHPEISKKLFPRVFSREAFPDTQSAGRRGEWTLAAGLSRIGLQVLSATGTRVGVTFERKEKKLRVTERRSHNLSFTSLVKRMEGRGLQSTRRF